MNLFHNQIESKFRRELESKVGMSKLLASAVSLKGQVGALTGLWPRMARQTGPDIFRLKAQRGQIICPRSWSMAKLGQNVGPWTPSVFSEAENGSMFRKR